VDYIKRMVADGVTWQEIRRTLNEEHGITVTPQTCANFYQRIKRRTQPLPGSLQPRKSVNPSLFVRRNPASNPPLEIID
jgi:hypothetical protein